MVTAYFQLNTHGYWLKADTFLSDESQFRKVKVFFRIRIMQPASTPQLP